MASHEQSDELVEEGGTHRTQSGERSASHMETGRPVWRVQKKREEHTGVCPHLV